MYTSCAVLLISASLFHEYTVHGIQCAAAFFYRVEVLAIDTVVTGIRLPTAGIEDGRPNFSSMFYLVVAAADRGRRLPAAGPVRHGDRRQPKA